MNKWNHQLTEWEIYEVRILLKEWNSIPKVAKKVWRNKTTIYRLLQSNNISYNQTKWKYIWWMIGSTWKQVEDNLVKVGKKKIQFSVKQVHKRRIKRKSNASMRYSRIEKGWKLEWYILEKIKKFWSPEQISWRRKLECGEKLSKDTIYSYIYTNYPELIAKYFRRKWKKYQNRRKEKYQLNDRKMIEQRPSIVEARERIWDWEGDTIIGRRGGNKEVILTNVDRKSWYLLARKIRDKSGNSVLEWTIHLFQYIPKYKQKTMTYDNGREFSLHSLIEYETNLKVYFAHPYCSRERGTNENTNWLLRQFLPKKTDFQSVSEKQLKKYVKLLNSRPRKRLNYKTPNEVFKDL
jgi:IS30 family transposase